MEWRITHNSGHYRIEYLLERGGTSVFDVLRGMPRRDVWVPASEKLYDSYDGAKSVAELNFCKWEPVSDGEHDA